MIGALFGRGLTRVVRSAFVALACAVSSVACGAGSSRPGAPIEYETGRRAAATLDGLHRVKARRISVAYLRPGASFAGYRSVLIEPVEVFYKRPPNDPRGMRGSGRGNWALEPRDMDLFRSLFQEALEKQMSQSQIFTIVDTPSPETLRIRGHIVDLVVNTPPERGPDIVFVSVSGEMTLILDVSDSQSLRPLARLSERREIKPGGSGGGLRRSGVHEWAEVRRIFGRWAQLLREGLEELPTLGPVPPRDSP